MAEERVDIVLKDRIDATIIPKMEKMVALALELQSAMTGAGGAMKAIKTGTVTSGMNRMNTSVKRANTSFISLGQTLRVMFQIYFAYAAAKRILEVADAYTTMANRLRLVTESAEGARDMLGVLYRVAQETRSPVDAIVRSFQRFDLAMQEMGRSQQDTIQLTKTVAEMLLLTGSTTEEARSGMLQLSQAFNKGKLDGDEFRTVMETMPLVARGLSDELGVTKKEMYAMAKSGELTADKLVSTILAVAPQINEEFEQLNETLGQSVTKLQNEALVVFGELNDELGGTNGLVSMVNKLTDALQEVAIIMQSLIVLTTGLAGIIAELGGQAIPGVHGPIAGIAGLARMMAEATPTPGESIYSSGQMMLISQALEEGDVAEALRIGENLYKFFKQISDEGPGAGMAWLTDQIRLRRNTLADGGRPAGEARTGRGTDFHDEPAYQNYLNRMHEESNMLNRLVEDREAYAQVGRLLQQLKRKDIELDQSTIEGLLEITKLHQENIRAGQMQLDMYMRTTRAVQDLRMEQDVLAWAYRNNMIGLYEYQDRYANTQAELIRLQEIMGETLSLSDTLKLAFLQIDEKIGRPIQEMADIFTRAMEDMTQSLGNLVAQWAVFGEAMRFIDVFRAVVAAIIQQLVALTAEYIIVGIARRWAGLPPIFGGGGGGGGNFSLGGNPHGMGETLGYQPPTLPTYDSIVTLPGGSGANVVVNNYTGSRVGVEQGSNGEIRIMIREEIVTQTPGVVASQVADPNSKVSRSLRQHTTAGRKGA